MGVRYVYMAVAVISLALGFISIPVQPATPTSALVDIVPQEAPFAFLISLALVVNGILALMMAFILPDE